MTFNSLQEGQKAWVQHNFPTRETFCPLLGMSEELGELAQVDDGEHILELCRALGKVSHHHLKEHQGIRGTPAEHQGKAKDAIGDIIIFLTDYCTARGFDLQEIVEKTWAEVSQRDFKKYPINGRNK